MIFSHVKISYFLRVFKYDFSQWPKTLYNTCVYIIKYFMKRGKNIRHNKENTSIVVPMFERTQPH
jgi:hypothetical protein